MLSKPRKKTVRANILSIHYGHNATVGLSKAGRMVAMVSEERITRIKNATGFPRNALQEVVNQYLDGDASQVDLLVISDESLTGYRYLQQQGFDARPYRDYFWKEKGEDIGRQQRLPMSVIGRRAVQRVRNRSAQREELTYSKAAAKEHLAGLTGVTPDRICFLDHHIAHAMTPLFFTGLEEDRLIFTLDGVGDGLCGSVSKWVARKKRLVPLDRVPADRSLGTIYSEVTGYLGMKPDEHEYKVMGLAPYADEVQASRVEGYFNDLLTVRKGKFHVTEDLAHIREWMDSRLAYERFDNVAGGLQRFAERVICDWVDYWIKAEKLGRIAVSGGVFMNVKASHKVAQLPTVASLFVAPSCGDESLPIGASLHGSLQLGVTELTRIRDLFLGRPLLDEGVNEIVEAGVRSGLFSAELLSETDLATRIAKLMSQGEIVAVARGREEWGARALGHRSIWCRPDDLAVIQTLNKSIKSRDFWMPFAPCILDSAASDYIEPIGDVDMSYMVIAADTTRAGRLALQAASHQYDHSIRPQVVGRDTDPFLYQVLTQFSAITGISAILNTSFNLHGEPIVGGAADAIHTLENSALTRLVLGSYLLTKTQ